MAGKSVLQELLGDTLWGKGSTKGTHDQVPVAQLENMIVGIYFSAHWCPPCRAFTPKLVETYNALKAAGKQFQIVFVSSDKSLEEFEDYYEQMPWLALPFTDAVRKQALSQKFKVVSVPTLALIGRNGELTKKNQRALVATDATGANFPWGLKEIKAPGASSSCCVIA